MQPFQCSTALPRECILVPVTISIRRTKQFTPFMLLQLESASGATMLAGQARRVRSTRPSRDRRGFGLKLSTKGVVYNN